MGIATMTPSKLEMRVDPEEIDRTLNLLFNFDSVIELRALHAPRAGTVSGYFDSEHRRELIEAASEWSGKASGVYVTLNPVDPTLLARANNRAKPFAKSNSTRTKRVVSHPFPHRWR
jgi:hypothetical protein